MYDRFLIDIAGAQSKELVQYSKMENVPLADLLYVEKPKKAAEHKLRTIAYHVLQRADKALNSAINRLAPEAEQNSTV